MKILALVFIIMLISSTYALTQGGITGVHIGRKRDNSEKEINKLYHKVINFSSIIQISNLLPYLHSYFKF